MGAPDEGDVQHAGQLNVFNIETAACNESQVFFPARGRSDHFRVLSYAKKRLDFSASRPNCSLAVASPAHI
jgi:hypothetical protein